MVKRDVTHVPEYSNEKSVMRWVEDIGGAHPWLGWIQSQDFKLNKRSSTIRKWSLVISRGWSLRSPHHVHPHILVNVGIPNLSIQVHQNFLLLSLKIRSFSTQFPDWSQYIPELVWISKWPRARLSKKILSQFGKSDSSIGYTERNWFCTISNVTIILARTSCMLPILWMIAFIALIATLVTSQLLVACCEFLCLPVCMRN